MKYIFAFIVLSIAILITINGSFENDASDTSSTTKRPNWQPIKNNTLENQVWQCASDSINHYNNKKNTNYTVEEILKKEQAGEDNGLLLRVRFNATFDCSLFVDEEEEKIKPCTYDTFIGKCEIPYTCDNVIFKKVRKLTGTTKDKEAHKSNSKSGVNKRFIASENTSNNE